jgi:hypothetical protein
MTLTGQITHRASFAGQIQEHVLKNGLGSRNHSGRKADIAPIEPAASQVGASRVYRQL